jgi:ethanolamine-phosphate phospho-lyase
MAAVVCRRALAESFASSGIEYFNTFGGNSVACRIAEAVIDVIEEERLQDNALKVGAYLSERMQSLVDRYEWVGEARGCGLFQGIEFVRSKSKVDRHFLDPFPELAKFLVDYLRYRHIIVSRDGPAENVIKIKPPLVFSCVDVDSLVDTMQRGLECALSLELFRNMQSQ